MSDSSAVQTTTEYDRVSANAGRQTVVDYSDTTPDISYTYDWMGNVATVEDAEGTRTFSYNYTTTGHPGLASVTIPGIVNHNISYTYDGYGRRTAMNLNNNSTPVLTNSYGYNATSGRLATVGDGTYTAHYTWQDGTGLLTQNQIKEDSTSSVITTHNRTYDTRTNNYHLLTTSNTTGATTRTYTYEYNTKDQRTKLTLADGTYWEYSYDDKGQVTSGTKKDASGNSIAGQYFGYSYDGIGNRVYAETKLSALKLLYTTNSVNQYTQIDIPGVVPVLGEADADTTVQAVRTDSSSLPVNQQKTVPTRSGKYFSGALTGIDNTTTAQTIPFDVYAIKDETTTQQVQKASSSYTVPKTPQTYTYDTDGNMTSDGTWTYTWNGENRMIAAESADKKLEFAYDFMGRRFSKKVYTGSTGNWTLASEQNFVYNGYKQIAEFDANDALQKSYTWQSIYPGVPLWLKDGSNYYYYIMDGNKNVRAIVDTSGNEVAQYDYNPFGKLTLSLGTYKDSNVYRFSSEYKDDETGLVYYKDRYFDEILSRWTKRDSIQEQGGANLYGFVQNSPINKWDYLGLSESKSCGTCGPDVTEWYQKDFQEHRNTYEKYSSSSNPYQAVEPLFFRFQAKYSMSHKWMNFNMEGCATGACKNTVSVCGACVRKNQLGNIMFGFISEAARGGDYRVWYAYSELNPVVRYKNGKDGPMRTDNLAAFALGRYLYKRKAFYPTPRKSFCDKFKKGLKKENIGYYRKLYDNKKREFTSKDFTTTPQGFDTSMCSPCNKKYPKGNCSSREYFKQLLKYYKKNGLKNNEGYVPWESAWETHLDSILENDWENYDYRGPDHIPGGGFSIKYLPKTKWVK